MDRRKFIASSVATGSAALFLKESLADDTPDPDRPIVADPFHLPTKKDIQAIRASKSPIKLLSSAYVIALPANKTLKFRLRINAGKENGLKVSQEHAGSKWYRNSYEVSGSTPLDETYGPTNDERDFVFEAWSKDCYLSNNPRGCPRRDWYHNYGPVREEETDTYYRIWWDDSRTNPQHANVELEVWIQD